MNQFNWTYLADNGQQHQVTLMHGATSGHLLVYCNTTILLIDFSVLKTSSYSFFIEEELCELTIERKGDQFFYGFSVDRDADTPLNNQRKQREKKHFYQSILFLGGLLLLASLFIVGITYYQGSYNQAQLKKQLELEGEITVANIFMVPKKSGEKAKYVFFVNGNSYSNFTSEAIIMEKGVSLLENGMSLEPGDEFLVRYLPGSPFQCQIDFSQPSPGTIEKYKERASQAYLAKFPNTTTEKASCLTEIAFQLQEIDGLASFYFSNTLPTNNSAHNEDSFYRLIRDVTFQKLANQNCQPL